MKEASMITAHNEVFDHTLCGVYYIRCINTAQIYIGMTTRSFEERWKEHYNDLENNTHRNNILQQCFNNRYELGVGILCSLRRKELIQKAETYLIHYYFKRVSLMNEVITRMAIEPQITEKVGTVNVVQDIQRRILACESKTRTIKILFNASPGGTLKYKAASKLYEAIKAKGIL